MRNKLQLKRAFFLGVISLLMLTSFGQDSYIKNRLNFKAGYSRYATGSYIVSSGQQKALTIGNYRLDANYGISNLIEAGVYVGFSTFESQKINWANTTILINDSSTPFYGINCNFHLLPLIIKKDDFRFDLYLTGKLGGLFFTSPSGYSPHGYLTEYGLGAGAAYYIGKHLGLYAEYCYGKYYYKDNSKLRYGLTMKF